MPHKIRNVIGLLGKAPGVKCNTEQIQVGTETNTFMKFTDTATPGDGEGNLAGDANNQFFNLISEVNWSNPSGGVDITPMQLRYFFDRNGVSATGVKVTARLNIWGVSEESDFPTKHLITSFINDSSTATSQTIADQVLDNFITGNNCYDELAGNAPANVTDWCFVVNEDGSTEITASYSYSSGYAFRLKSKNIDHVIEGSIVQSGQVALTKFEQLPAFSTRSFDIITKDVDFGFTGSRKKVYKVIVTYKAPYDMSGIPFGYLSNVQPFYALNGRTRLAPAKFTSDWKPMVTRNLPSTQTSDHDARWIRAELKPDAGSSAWNNIYSMAIRFRAIEGLEVKGFEINDISFVYRLKSPK